MITFKQYLAEKALNKSIYAEVFKKYGDDALIGFEIEVFIKQNTPLHTGAEKERDYMIDISSIKTLSALNDIFSISRGDMRSITNAHTDWLTEQASNYVDEHWQDFLDGDEDDDEEQARSTLWNEIEAHIDQDINYWFNEEFTVYSFIQTFDLQPQFGWVDENGDHSVVYIVDPDGDGAGENWENTANSLAAVLQTQLDKTVEVKPGANGAGVNKYWVLTTDSSITDGDKDTEHGFGIEIISPPTPAADAIKELKTVFSIISKYEISTNNSTGLHVNISIPEIKQSLDALKLVLFMGDEHTLAKFDRLTNSYTNAQISKIINNIGKPTDIKKFEQLARDILNNSGKYHSVNLNKLTKGYLEFRALGGSDYHKKFDAIEDTIGKWLTVIDLACDPNANRAEYLKKLTKLFNRVDNKTDILASKVPGKKINQLSTK